MLPLADALMFDTFKSSMITAWFSLVILLSVFAPLVVVPWPPPVSPSP